MEKTLRGMPFTASKVLVTGATGYLGALIVASLLRDTNARIVCLPRAVHDRNASLRSSKSITVMFFAGILICLTRIGSAHCATAP